MAIQENARFQEITQARLTVTSQGSSEGLTKPDQTPVENILNRMSFVRRRRITKQLAREIDDNGDSKAGAVIATLFNSSSTKDYKRKLDTKAIAPEEAVDIFQQPVVPHLVQLLANEPRRPDFQLGVMMAHADTPDFDEIKEDLGIPESDDQFKILPYEKDWELCKKAEWRMQKSIGDDMATVVNGRIVMKGAGRLAGLCLETFTSQSGQVFWENNWYAPLYPKLRTKIRAAIIQGDTSLETEQGQWMQLRTVGNNFWLPSADLLSTLRQFVAESGKTRTLSAEEIKARREYIRREKELFRLPTGTVFSEEVTDPFAEE